MINLLTLLSTEVCLTRYSGLTVSCLARGKSLKAALEQLNNFDRQPLFHHIFFGKSFFFSSFLFAISLQQGVGRVLGLPRGGGGGPGEVGGGRGERGAAGGEAGVREGKRRSILQSRKQGQGTGPVKLLY